MFDGGTNYDSGTGYDNNGFIFGGDGGYTAPDPYYNGNDYYNYNQTPSDGSASIVFG